MSSVKNEGIIRPTNGEQSHLVFALRHTFLLDGRNYTDQFIFALFVYFSAKQNEINLKVYWE